MQKPTNSSDDQEGSTSATVKYRRVPANLGSTWLVKAWHMFKLSKGPWLGITGFIFLMLLIPGINYLSAVLMPVAIGGLMLGCSQVSDKASIKFDHLFDGLKTDSRELLKLCGIYALASILMKIFTIYIMSIVGIDYQQLLVDITPKSQSAMSEAEALEWATKLLEDNTILYLLLGFLIYLALMIPVFMGVWFAPALIVLRKQTAGNAFLLSFQACRDNFIPFLVYGLFALAYLLLAFFIVSTIMVILPFVGIPLWFVIIMATFAISVISIYTSYCDLFYSDSDEQVVHNDDSSSSMIA